MINCQQIWLFETSVSDPFFIGERDGVTCQMSDQNTIDLLSINTVIYRMNSNVEGAVEYSPRYGGDPVYPLEFYGLNQYEFSIQFNMPLFNVSNSSLFWGKSYSVMWRQNDGNIKVVFGQYKAQNFTVDNLYIQRVTLSTNRSNAKIFDVNSLNITTIINDISGFTSDIITPPFIQGAQISDEQNLIMQFTNGQVSFLLNEGGLTIISDDATAYSYEEETGSLLFDDGT